MRVIETAEILTLPEGNYFEVLSLSRSEAEYYAEAYMAFTKQVVLGTRFSKRAILHEPYIDRLAVEVNGDDIPSATNVIGFASIRSVAAAHKRYARIESMFIDSHRTLHMQRHIGNLLLKNSGQIQNASDDRVMVDPLLEANESAKSYLEYIGFESYTTLVHGRKMPKHMKKDGPVKLKLFRGLNRAELEANLLRKDLY